MNSINLLWQYRVAFFDGLIVTIELVVFASVVGTMIACALEWGCIKAGGSFRRSVDFIAFGVSTIPPLVILFWLHYPAQSVLNIVISPFWTALLALTLLNIFAVYRIVADAVHDFPQQFIATALVNGLTKNQIARYIQLPLLFRAALPRWIDQQVVIFQTSLFASLISVEETFRVAQRINSIEYQPVAIYTSMAILFFLTAGAAMYYARYLRMKFYRDFSER